MSDTPTNPSDGSSQFTMGKLRKDEYSSAQEFAEDIAFALSGSQPINGAQSGSRITKKTDRFGIQAGASTVDAPYDLSDCILNLECSDDAPTRGILCIRGSKVFLTGATPTANYTLAVTKITVF